ncbi:fluoride efflux transporter FluC [Lederbergia wuyishanensis]|uniref:Fluoride-specific ion channel FluC n=1 Tax=Lederbergia wuyishanensis TaxID=1347903 RepID=A0ABU0D019_9BACI|nr:CrcB family protein [Lederbergia wuyishanensis]MCJ8006374.1 CrcB family protein [Lederbergia wuyishanensis]MDQ0341743.1 CrcB protein [Lederbergia wuyishanensis]
MTILYVAIGGFLGSIARYTFSKFIKISESQFPIPTFIVNIIGSFFLGFIIGASIPTGMNLFFGIGFLGSFTTYSTFMVENMKMILENNYKKMFLYTCLSYIIGITFALGGLTIGISIGK